jgi:iron only hydrogenase large subunit-like protein
MSEVEILVEALQKKEWLAAMLAPSFPIVFSYPQIITQLRKLRFTYIVEVSAGAKKTNEELLEKLKNNPQRRYITSPCPTVVRMVRRQMPQFAKYFPEGVDSPMVATAKIIREKFSGYRPVFIGPCIVKKLEAKEDIPELNILVLTYEEIKQVLAQFKISDDYNPQDKFDISEPGLTRIYPVDGGLSHSCGLTSSFYPKQIQIVSGWKQCQEAIRYFDENPQIRLLDILFCDEGCIGGPGIKSNLSLKERKRKVIAFAKEI